MYVTRLTVTTVLLDGTSYFLCLMCSSWTSPSQRHDMLLHLKGPPHRWGQTHAQTSVPPLSHCCVSVAPKTWVKYTPISSSLHSHLTHSHVHCPICILAPILLPLTHVTRCPILFSCLPLSIIVLGMANITLQFKVHSGWRSLVTVATIRGEFSISRTVTIPLPFGPPMTHNRPTLAFPRISIPVEVCCIHQLSYLFTCHA